MSLPDRKRPLHALEQVVRLVGRERSSRCFPHRHFTPSAFGGNGCAAHPMTSSTDWSCFTARPSSAQAQVQGRDQLW